MIEDFTVGSSSPLSSVALQFLVYVFNSNQSCLISPVFIPPTTRADTCIAIPPGETFNTQIIANSLSSDISITEIETVSPSGMMKGNLTRILNSNLYFVNISWTPNDLQQNQTHLFCYTAVNSDGIQNDQICVKFFPGIFPPKPINLLRSENTKWSIFFNKKIQRPSIPAFISFYQADTDEQVHKIDTSSSTEVILQNQINYQ